MSMTFEEKNEIILHDESRFILIPLTNHLIFCVHFISVMIHLHNLSEQIAIQEMSGTFLFFLLFFHSFDVFF